ncbi:MAG: hypothetical protein Q8S94_11305 [Pseudohongiella sp.]|nr:hypothetical protein [Pseudohongiella sp.]
MKHSLYLPRKLACDDETYTEVELLDAARYVVVLAEPGGGKTELMKSLAQHLGTRTITASKFSFSQGYEKNTPLVIDAFDELATLDSSNIYKLLGQAVALNPTRFYLSSRSSEWGIADTTVFKDFIGQDPLVVRLCEFDPAEQRVIFEHHVQGEDFVAFQAEVARFDLEALLPNPQFLKLFADAYVESGRHFIDKRSIFTQAVERLAKETNPSAQRVNRPISVGQKIAFSSEIFAKLLLSGAEGICTSEAHEHRTYPLLATLSSCSTEVDIVLATRLFKLGDSPDHHRPVHKIVSEYCAAGYLISRIADPADPLTLSKCLSIMAPNSTVRDQLRGLLGWMASLGNRSIAEALINLDPYAVLANGDPSQLDDMCKRLLASKLKEIEIEDPYFRKGDFWRKYSVAGFFTDGVVDEIKPLLASGGNGQLRDLILELLRGSAAIKKLTRELRNLRLTESESENTRFLASRCLLDIEDYSHICDLEILISEASHTALEIAADVFKSLGPEKFNQNYLASYFRACSKLYPSHKDSLGRILGQRYFVKRFIAELDLTAVIWLLDELTKNLSCTCGKEVYECDCRNGISKIIGSMLDRYFELATAPFEPAQVWRWLGNLNFHHGSSTDLSKSVQVLQTDSELRQGVIAHVFGRLTDRDKIFETKVSKFDWHTHAGLNFRGDDYRFVVDLAFETDNPNLWAVFMARHQYYRNNGNRGPDHLRQHMRKQALEKPAFMKEWAKSNRAAALQLERDQGTLGAKHRRRMKRRLIRDREIRLQNIKYVQDNRAQIESGRHWSCLLRFAELVLHYPEKIEEEFGDETLIRNALRNCLDFISPAVPDLPSLGAKHCASKYTQSEQILYAACLEILRGEGNLEKVDLHLLQALRTDVHINYKAVTQEDRNALEKEVNRLVFSDTASAENFLRDYLEPQLKNSACSNPKVWLLREDAAFRNARATLPVEWLRQFSEMSFEALDSLFSIATQFSNRDDLKMVIAGRCSEIMSRWPELTNDADIEKKRTFWLLRAWYFLPDIPKEYWNWLKTDPNTLLLIQDRSGQSYNNDHANWPPLTARKVEDVLDAFIDKWPKVELPHHWGTGSPKEETTYRFLMEVVWKINADDPGEAIKVLDRLLADPRYAGLHKGIRSIRADQTRKKALRNFSPPTPQEIVSLLDQNILVNVEGLRQLMIQELQIFQNAINGGEFNSANHFYDQGGQRLGEIRCTEIIAERLNLRLEPQGIAITPEHQLKDAKRTDFSASKMIGGRRRLLVTEVKGQWHPELYKAASTQLHDRYAIHPDAEHQGIFLAIWFGADEKVAGRIGHSITSAQELRSSIEEDLPIDLKGLIDIFVLDVSRPK